MLSPDPKKNGPHHLDAGRYTNSIEVVTLRSQSDDVLGRLAAIGLYQIKFYFFALLQSSKAPALNAGMMNETFLLTT
jgi:hypothetical protein